MIALTTLLPRKSSRTSTQAMRVPVTPFTSTTSREATNVSLSAATAAGEVTSSQNAESPPSNDDAITAAIGMRTMSVRYAVESPRTRPPARLDPPVRAGSLTASELVVSRDSQLVLDVEEDALLAVEEPRADVAPAAEVGDREEAGRLRVVELAEHVLDHWAVALLAEHALGVRRAEVVDELLRRGRTLARVDDGDGVLDQDGLVGHDVLDGLVLLLGEDGLVLVGEEDVALPVGERLQRLPRALVLDGDVLDEELAQVIDRLLVGLALLELRSVGGHDVPLGAAGGERVRRDHLDAVLQKVVPGLDVLGVSLADDEDDHGVGHHAVVFVLVPVRVDQARLDQPRDVGLERERDDVGVEPRLDGPALLAGRRVGLVEVDAGAGVRVLESRDDFLVGLAGGRVGDEGERAAASRRAGGVVAAAAAGGREREKECCERRGHGAEGDVCTVRQRLNPTFSTR